MSKSFGGVFTALVTPFLPDESIDEKSLEALIQKQVAGSVHGLVLAGSTGEGATLSLEERIKLVKLTKKLIKDQLVIAGAGHNSTREAISLQKALEDAGVDATLQVVPYYNKPTKEGLLKHFSLIARSSKTPIILYNVPGRTGIDMPVSIIAKLLKEEENIIGIKESNPNLEKLLELIATIKTIRPNSAIFTGEDSLFLPSLALGANGIISVASNIILKDFINLYSYMKNNNIMEAQKIAYKTKDICHLLFSHSNPIPVKTILYKLGLINNIYRLPLCPLLPEEEKLLWERFKQLINL